jgi:acetylornithine deacetylase
VTAARTVCTLALRPMPNDHHEEAVRMIRDAATRHGLVSAAFMFPVVYTDPASEVVRAAIDVTGAKCSQTVSFGTEAAVYKDHCQLVILGPGDIAQAHTVGEWIDIDQLRSAVDVYARMISQFCL